MPKSYLTTLGRFVAELDYDKLPEDTRRAARYQVLNMLATVFASARSAETAAIAEGLAGFSIGQGRSTAFATATQHGPHEAAMANAAYSMAQDFDDIVWMGHTGHSAVFAPLAVSEHEHTDARRFLTAVIVANEIGGRLGASSFFGPLNGQMWTFIHLISAAAATAKVLGLSATETTHALAISLSQPNFPLQPGFMLPSSKLLAAATPTSTGIQAAYFARAGMTGAPDILEDRRGFWKRFSYLPLPSMLEGLGTFWVMQTLTAKTYPGCHYFQTAVSALDKLEERHGRIAPQAIRRVMAETTKFGIEATRFAAAYAAQHKKLTPVNANFDLSATLAIRLIAGKLTGDELQPEWLAHRALELRALQQKIHVQHDPVLTVKTISSARAIAAGKKTLAAFKVSDLFKLARKYKEEYGATLFSYREAIPWWKAAAKLPSVWKSEHDSIQGETPSAIPLYFPNRVTLELGDGSIYTEQVDLPLASFCSKQVQTQLQQKFLRETAPALGPKRAADAFTAGLKLGEGELADLIRLVTK